MGYVKRENGKILDYSCSYVDGYEEISNADYKNYMDNYKLYFETAPAWYLDRINAYGSIESQLDMQYHDNIDGTTNWKDKIAQIKEDNPKTPLSQEQVDWLQANGLYAEYCNKYHIGD